MTLPRLLLDLWEPHPAKLAGQDASNCRLLLIEIIRRACFDWILYRGSRRMVHKMLASSAYVWLFMEQPGTPMWKTRVGEDRLLTSFNHICREINVDPDCMRATIRRMSVHDVKRIDRFQLDRAVR